MSQHRIKKNKQQNNNESIKKDQIDNKNYVYFSDDIRQKITSNLNFDIANSIVKSVKGNTEECLSDSLIFINTGKPNFVASVIEPVNKGPCARQHHSMAYDPKNY